VVGVAADMVIEAGGTFMMAETGELIGCGEVLAERAVSEQAAQDIREAIETAERRAFEHGRFSIGLGNIRGGLTTIDEKSAGALSKGGTKPLQGVIRDFEPELGKGFYIEAIQRDAGTFAGDPEGLNRMTACGANVALFTTGCGSVTGAAIAPVIKICGNPITCERIADNLDLDASPIMRGEKTIQEMGEELYQEILAVAGGKLTRSEVTGHFEA
jgi:altronate dehydratase